MPSNLYTVLKVPQDERVDVVCLHSGKHAKYADERKAPKSFEAAHAHDLWRLVRHSHHLGLVAILLYVPIFGLVCCLYSSIMQQLAQQWT